MTADSYYDNSVALVDFQVYDNLHPKLKRVLQDHPNWIDSQAVRLALRKGYTVDQLEQLLRQEIDHLVATGSNLV